MAWLNICLAIIGTPHGAYGLPHVIGLLCEVIPIANYCYFIYIERIRRVS